MWPTSCHVYLALVQVTAPAILPRATSPFLLPGPLNALLSESPKAEELQAWKDMALCVSLAGVKCPLGLSRGAPLKGNESFKDIYLYWDFWPQKMQKLWHVFRDVRDSVNPQGQYLQVQVGAQRKEHCPFCNVQIYFSAREKPPRLALWTMEQA